MVKVNSSSVLLVSCKDARVSVSAVPRGAYYCHYRYRRHLIDSHPQCGRKMTMGIIHYV